MAITGGARLPVSHDEVFPSGALVMGVEPMLKFQSGDDKARGVPAQPETDKISGLPMFAVTVIDQAAERKADAVVTVKIAAQHQPVPPEAIPRHEPAPGRSSRALTLTPWIDDKACRSNPGERHKCRARLAYSLRASGMKPVNTGTGRTSKADATKAA